MSHDKVVDAVHHFVEANAQLHRIGRVVDGADHQLLDGLSRYAVVMVTNLRTHQIPANGSSYLASVIGAVRVSDVFERHCKRDGTVFFLEVAVMEPIYGALVIGLIQLVVMRRLPQIRISVCANVR